MMALKAASHTAKMQGQLLTSSGEPLEAVPSCRHCQGAHLHRMQR